MIENTFAERQREAALRFCHMTASLLAQGLASLKFGPEILITHLEPGKSSGYYWTRVAALAGRWRPRPVRACDIFQF